MLALLDSGTYNTYQLIDWQVDWTNSSTTVTEDGIGFKLGAPDASFTHADMVAEPAISADTYFTDNVTPVFDGWGRAPLVSEYWESGAPIGITTARRAVLYWRGKIAADSSWLEGTGDIWLGFAGSGSVKVIHDGTIVLAGAPLDTDSIRYTSLLDVTEDDVIEIYYWQLNEAWGGIVGKYIPQPTVTDTTPTTAMYREAPVISASLLPYEAETPGVTLPRVTSADLSVNSPNDASTMKFTVPLASSDETLGWSVSNSPRVIQHYDGTDTHTLRRYNLVTLSGGFQGELYDRFTGYLNNFQESDGKITVECFSTDRRLAMAQVENYPDRMSYLTFGYFKKETSSEPVQDIPAYDAWPLEHAIKDLCYKAGVDPKRFAAVRQYNNAGTLTDKEDLFAGTKSKLFNATSVSGDLITLQRQSRYGNSGLGFNEHKSADEAYIYGPDTAKTVIDWVRALADGLGYDFRVNGSGDFVLSSRNNPHRASEITEGSSVFNAGAYGGFYQNLTSSFTATNKVYASRIDLVVGRHEDLGEVDYTVYYGDGVNSGTVASAGTMDISLAGDTTGTFLYDDRFTLSGDNAAIVTLHTGDWRCYVVELSEGEGTQWWLDTLLLYDHDPATSQYAESFKTNKAALSLVTDSQATDARNRVVVIGKRKSAVTDSAKFRNPNNPSSEFAVAVGADPGSIWDPTTDNYVGTKLSTIIVDDKIADQDYADWVAQTLLVRQCAPAPAPEFTHTLIPIMEPRDPITVADSAYGTVTDDVQAWVVGYTEKYTVSEAISSIRATSYSEIPSYEPKEDINLATLDSQFGGKPVAGLSITYTSLDNVVITNPDPNLPTQYTTEEQGYESVSSDGNGTYVDCSSRTAWPPIPGSIRLMPIVTQQERSSQNKPLACLKNNPYMKLWHLYDTDYVNERIHIPCLTGDGTTGYQRDAWGLGTSSMSVSYRGLNSAWGKADIYGGECPFYDPYSSELSDANLVDIQFDVLISGFYRAAVMAKDPAGGEPIRVAWLSEPGVDASEPEAHWVYLSAGNNKQFLWDGVDNIGTWNKAQSEDYSWNARGVFELDQKPAIGAGFYAWNNQNSELVTISGQKVSGSGPVGKLEFNDDHYSQFYVEIEGKCDAFVDTTEPIRTVSTDDLITTSSLNPQAEIYIYTHLPPPTQVRITAVEDWDMSTNNPWADGTTEDEWTSSPDTGATIRDNKPVRLTYEALERPGELFAGEEDMTSFKMNRMVHLNVNIMDMFMIFEGRSWLTTTDVERKRLVCRKLTNSEHTVSFADTDFRLGSSLTNDQWIFIPENFKIDDHPLEYADYLQFEDVPEYNRNRELGGTRSRFLMGYMNYIFYLSTYIQDRSGRMTWTIDDSYVDKGKLTTNVFYTEFPEEPDTYFNRTLVARQWNDPTYVTDMQTKWTYGAGDPADYTQFFWNRLESEDTASAPLRLSTTGTAVNGTLQTTSAWDAHTAYHKANDSRLPADYSAYRQLGTWADAGTHTLDFFGAWTWEGSTAEDDSPYTDKDPLWIPAPTRDWHSYFLVPPMPLQGGSDLVDDNWYSQIQVEGDKDCAAGAVWFSRAYAMANDDLNDKRRFWPGHSAEEYIDDKTSRVAGTLFDYTRQNELMHWEHYRGMITGGPLQDDQRAYQIVQSVGEPYLMNWYRYDEFEYSSRIIRVIRNRAEAIGTGPLQVTIDDRPAASVASWFDATFRHQFNWESANHFPIDKSSGRLHSEFLNLKYDPQQLPAWLVYDGGAWTGWKDDYAVGDTRLRWKYSGSLGGVSYGEKNIFLWNPQGGFYAVGPETPEKTDIMVSLVLLNNRRGSSVSL